LSICEPSEYISDNVFLNNDKDVHEEEQNFFLF